MGGWLIATTNNDVNLSHDDGDTWTRLELGRALPLPYFRGLTQLHGAASPLLLGNGDAPPGTTGLIATFERCGPHLASRADAGPGQ